MEIAIIIIAAGVILAILTAGFAGFVYILKILGEGIANIFGERNKENADKLRSSAVQFPKFIAVQFSKFIDDIKKRELDSNDLVLLAFIILFIICMIAIMMDWILS